MILRVLYKVIKGSNAVDTRSEEELSEEEEKRIQAVEKREEEKSGEVNGHEKGNGHQVKGNGKQGAILKARSQNIDEGGKGLPRDYDAALKVRSNEVLASSTLPATAS